MGLLDNPQDAAMLQLGLGLLSAGGPSRSPVSLGQAIGSAGQGAMEEYRRTQALQQQMAQRKMQEQMQQMQMQQAQREAARQAQQDQYLENMIPSLPTEQQAFARAFPKEFAATMTKDRQPVFDKVSPDKFTPESLAKFSASRNYADLAPIEKHAAGTELDKLIAARDALPVGHPNRRIYDQAINKASTHTPPIQVQNYPAPMPAMNPATGQTELIQFGNKGDAKPTGFKPPQQAIPATASAAIMENRKALSTIDEAISEVQKKPDSLGVPNYLGDAIRQRTDPGGVPARSKVAQVGGIRLHDLSGAAVTATELKRLQPYIPTATDSPEAAVKKLQTLRKEYADMISQQEATFGKDQGYRPIPNSQTTKQVVRRGRYGGKPVVEYSDGSVEYAN